MKVLVFHIGPDRYGLPLACIRRVLPLMALKTVPGAPDAVAGLMNLHGSGIPVLDVSRQAGAAAAARQADTRIVLVDYTAPDGTVHGLGLVAERVQGVQPSVVLRPLQAQGHGRSGPRDLVGHPHGSGLARLGRVGGESAVSRS